MTRDQRIIELGSIGERLVMKHFDIRGCVVEQSDNPYDSEKDMTIDGHTVEVKTLVPIFKYNAFCLPVQQSRKCESVDRLIFVRMPTNPGADITLLESVKDKDTGRRYDFRDWFNGEKCQFYRLTNLQEVGIMQDQDASITMWNLSPSIYKGNVNAA